MSFVPQWAKGNATTGAEGGSGAPSAAATTKASRAAPAASAPRGVPPPNHRANTRSFGPPMTPERERGAFGEGIRAPLPPRRRASEASAPYVPPSHVYDISTLLDIYRGMELEPNGGVAVRAASDAYVPSFIVRESGPQDPLLGSPFENKAEFFESWRKARRTIAPSVAANNGRVARVPAAAGRWTRGAAVPTERHDEQASRPRGGVPQGMGLDAMSQAANRFEATFRHGDVPTREISAFFEGPVDPRLNGALEEGVDMAPDEADLMSELGVPAAKSHRAAAATVTARAAVSLEDMIDGYEWKSAASPVAPPALAPVAPLSPPQSPWYYRDPSGRVQGPFTAEQMRSWLAQKFFHDSLPVRYGETPVDAFFPLAMVYPAGSAFAFPPDVDKLLRNASRAREREARRLEEARRVAEEARRAEEEARRAEAQRRAEQARRVEEQRLAEEQRRAEQARRVEEERRVAEEARRAAEAQAAQQRAAAQQEAKRRAAAEEAKKRASKPAWGNVAAGPPPKTMEEIQAEEARKAKETDSPAAKPQQKRGASMASRIAASAGVSRGGTAPAAPSRTTPAVTVQPHQQQSQRPRKAAAPAQAKTTGASFGGNDPSEDFRKWVTKETSRLGIGKLDDALLLYAYNLSDYDETVETLKGYLPGGSSKSVSKFASDFARNRDGDHGDWTTQK